MKNYVITAKREKLVYEEIEIEVNLDQWAIEKGLEFDNLDELAYEYLVNELDIWDLGGNWEETGEEEVNKEWNPEIISVKQIKNKGE